MLKCDFCDKPAVGYTIQQIACYCDDHEELADKITNDTIDIHDACREEMYAIGYSEDVEDMTDD